MIVMMLFLHLWRNAVVVMVSIPTSILSTFVLMNAFGFHLDSMSLMGLSLIIGILVDDSIVVLENITRHRDLGEDPIDAAINGRSEIGGAAVAITMVDVVVFLPIAFMPGLVGMYLKEFGAVIVIATLFSLFVSFTLTPLLAARWSVRERSPGRPKWLDALRSWKVMAAMLGGAAVAYVIPWGKIGLPKELNLVIPVMVVAVLLLNGFVQNYDRIIDWYKTRALGFALDHGLFVVFVCAVLVINALTLVAGAGKATIVVNVLILLVTAGWHSVGMVMRGRSTRWFPWYSGVPRERLELKRRRLPRTASGFARMRVAISDMFLNSFRLFGQWFYATGRSTSLTIVTFAFPVVVAIAFVLLGSIDFDFVPAVQDGSISMTVTYPPGTPLLVTEKFVSQLEQGILKVDGLQSVSSTVGRKPEGWGTAIGSNYARLNAQTTPERTKETYKIIDQIRKLKYLVPGGELQVAGESGGGSGTPIFYALSGPEDAIGPAAEKVAQFLRDTPGSVNVQTSNEMASPRLNVNVDAQKSEVLRRRAGRRRRGRALRDRRSGRDQSANRQRPRRRARAVSASLPGDRRRSQGGARARAGRDDRPALRHRRFRRGRRLRCRFSG